MREIDLGICAGRLWEGERERAATILPGAAYLPGYPLLWFAREVLTARGWTVLEVLDTYDGATDPALWVRQRAEAALAATAGASRLLLVGKSISSHAAEIAAARALPGVWLTPILTNEAIVAALARRTAPALLVGGTSDRLWDGALARRSGADVLELPGADHSLQLRGDPIASIDALRQTTAAIDAFVDSIT